MKIKYDKIKLQQIVNDISILSDISIGFWDADFNLICRKIKSYDFCAELQNNKEIKYKCACSDNELIERCKKSRSFEEHICHAGLYDATIPVIKNGLIVGYVIMGRVRCDKSPSNFETDNEHLKELYNAMPYFTIAKIESLKSLLQDILFENAITYDCDEIIDKACAYIKNNIKEDLSISSLCSKLCVSKNYLYNGFKKYLDKTINEYITDLKIEKAKYLLTETNLPVYTICEEIGINNYTYFCRLFKKITNKTPTEYRKKQNI